MEGTKDNNKSAIESFLKHSYFNRFIIFLICINAIILGLDTDTFIYSKYGSILDTVDNLIVWVFTLELLSKMIVYKKDFFKSKWYIFDLVVVTIAWLPNYTWLSILRSLRILRVLRLVSAVPQIRLVVTAMGHSIPGMTSVVGLLSLIFYVASVLVTNVFGNHNDANMQEWFGSVSASAYTLFEVMSLNTSIIRTTMDLFPWSWLFFIPFVIITSFAVLNFIIGIIVDSMSNAERLEAEMTGVDDDLPLTKEDLRILLAKLDSLEEKLERVEKAKKG